MTIEVAKGTRPSFLDLWLSYHFSLPDLAHLAEVDESIVQDMLNGLPVQRGDAEAVLTQLSAVLHKSCTLYTMHVPIQPSKEENKSQIARLMWQIDAEFVSSWQAIHGLTCGTSEHRFITKRTENIGKYLQAWYGAIGPDGIMDLYGQWANRDRKETHGPI